MDLDSDMFGKWSLRAHCTSRDGVKKRIQVGLNMDTVMQAKLPLDIWY